MLELPHFWLAETAYSKHARLSGQTVFNDEWISNGYLSLNDIHQMDVKYMPTALKSLKTVSGTNSSYVTSPAPIPLLLTHYTSKSINTVHGAESLIASIGAQPP
jgi:hypothetical protein